MSSVKTASKDSMTINCAASTASNACASTRWDRRFHAILAKPVITREAQAGQPIVSSIDLDLQRVAYKALGDRSGAVVAVDPQTGEVLAMVSRPSFDPNVFTRKITKPEWKRLNAPDHPLFNRA